MHSSGYLLRQAAGLLGLLTTTGCAVYAPTVPSTPILAPRQVQLTAGVRGLNALEAGAAWSPAPHLLLSGEAAWQSRSEGSTNANGVQTDYQDYHRQGSLALGYYRGPADGSRPYWAVLGGVGWASTNLHGLGVGLLFILPVPVIDGFYEARYRRLYAQAYLARPLGGGRLLGGASLRLTRVDYRQLSLDGQPLAPATGGFAEPLLFVQDDIGPAFFARATLGLSVPLRRAPDPTGDYYTAPVSGLLGVSLGLRPALLRAQWRR